MTETKENKWVCRQRERTLGCLRLKLYVKGVIFFLILYEL